MKNTVLKAFVLSVLMLNVPVSLAMDEEARACRRASFLVQDDKELLTLLFRSISLYEMSPNKGTVADKCGMAYAYSNAARRLNNKEKSLDFALKSAALFEELGAIPDIAMACSQVSFYAQDEKQSLAYALKAISFYEKSRFLPQEKYDKLMMKHAYEKAANHTEDKAQKAAYLEKAKLLSQ